MATNMRKKCGNVMIASLWKITQLEIRNLSRQMGESLNEERGKSMGK